MADGHGHPTASSADRFAYATLVTSDAYVDGALVLLHSLRRTLTPYTVLCLATPSTLSDSSLRRLQQHFDGVIETDLRQSTDECGLALLGRPDLWSTLTKIQLWDPALFGAWSAVCYLDADTLVRLPIDDVFSRYERWRSTTPDWTRGGLVAASPDTGWPDCFNSGVMLLAPGHDCHRDLCQRAAQASASFDGADQGLLNEHFADWSEAEPFRRLPFLYNATANVYYTYAPALQRFGHDVRVVHFIGASKPWHWQRTPGGQLLVDPSMPERWQQLVGLWWNIHDEHVSGWRHYRGPIDKAVAFGAGYHHIAAPAPAQGPDDARGDGLADKDRCSPPAGAAREVPDWDKDWSWAEDRVHPLDYAYLAAHTAPAESSREPTQRQPPSDSEPDHAQPGERHAGRIVSDDSDALMPHAADPTVNAGTALNQPHRSPATGHSGGDQVNVKGTDHRRSLSSPPQWMQSQRPWEDVAREGWLHSDEYRPHAYDEAYVERHARQVEVREQQHDEHQWSPRHSPVPLPTGQNLYEASQVVLLPRHDSGRPDQVAHSHHHPAPAEQGFSEQHHHHSDLDHAAYINHENQPRQPSSERRDSQTTSGGSPLFYPQPKSPVVVNPVALWESSKEQAQRKAWAQQVRVPQDGDSDVPLGRPHAHDTAIPAAPAAAWGNIRRVPLSAIDHIDSSQLPPETPWKISHVRHRPPADAGGGGSQPAPSGMQFKEGVANDTGAREAASQILQRWNEGVMARGIGAGIRPEQFTHNAPVAEEGTDAIRLETTVSCEAEGSNGERTVYRFTLSSTLDIGGAHSQPAVNTSAAADGRAPVLSRPSSFAMLQESAARASHAGSERPPTDQFAESDAQYWRLQRQLIDLEMSQQHREAQTPPPAGSAPDLAPGGGFGMPSRGPSMFEADSPPTPSYRQPVQRRPSAFSIADPESLALASHPPVAPIALAGDSFDSWPVNRSLGDPHLVAGAAQVPARTARFTQSSTEPSDSDDGDTSASSTQADPVRPAIGRTPTPFPRGRMGLAPVNGGDGSSNSAAVASRPERPRPRPPALKPIVTQLQGAGFGAPTFGIPAAAVGAGFAPGVPGQQAGLGQAVYDGEGDDDDDDSFMPADNGDDDLFRPKDGGDELLNAQWHRIVRGAPPPRTVIAVSKEPADTAASDSMDADPVVTIAPSAEPPDSDIACGNEDPAEAGSEDGDADDVYTAANTGSNYHAESPATVSASPSVGGTPEPPRRERSQKAFTNLTSRVFDTVSDSDLDPSEAEQQETFWARAMKRTRSGMSTPYSPGRRKSLAELSSMISPQDLDEWMQWQDDSSNVLARGPAVEKAGSVFMPATGALHEPRLEPITPPASKERTGNQPAAPASSNSGAPGPDGAATCLPLAGALGE